jgi:hypothetical protein
LAWPENLIPFNPYEFIKTPEGRKQLADAKAPDGKSALHYVVYKYPKVATELERISPGTVKELLRKE